MPALVNLFLQIVGRTGRDRPGRAGWAGAGRGGLGQGWRKSFVAELFQDIFEFLNATLEGGSR